MWNSKIKRRLSNYPNRSPCWCRQPTTPLGRRAGGRKEPELRSQAMGSQVLRPAVFPDVLVRTRHPWRMPWRVFVLEHLERWWTVSWDPRHQFAAYLNSFVHFTWSDFKQLKKLWGIFLAQCKKIACSHRHASTAGMGMLTRTAIGIINKTEWKRRNGKDKEGKED